MSTFAKIRGILIDQGADSRDIKPAASFVGLGLDSLEMAQLVIELEEAFGIEIPDDDFQKFITVQNAVDYADQNCATI